MKFAELQIRLFCVEIMSLEPSELIAAFESKVPFFRGHGLGVQCELLKTGNFWLRVNIFYNFVFEEDFVDIHPASLF